LRDGYAPTISDRIANKGLSASAYTDNYNLERHSSSESLRAFQSIARYTTILVRDALLDCTDIHKILQGLLNMMAVKNQANFIDARLLKDECPMGIEHPRDIEWSPLASTSDDGHEKVDCVRIMKEISNGVENTGNPWSDKLRSTSPSVINMNTNNAEIRFAAVTDFARVPQLSRPVPAYTI
ncbi:hypothetical protein ALC56_09374, partial [Trachymyrmex septentrionalis]